MRSRPGARCSPRRCFAAGGFISALGFFATLAGGARAQDTVDAVQEQVTIHPAPALREFAARVADALRMRLAVRVEVSDEPPQGGVEAVEPGSVGMAVSDGGQIQLAFVAPSGFIAQSQVPSEARDEDVARAAALAIEVLWESAMSQPVPERGEDLDTPEPRIRNGVLVTWRVRPDRAPDDRRGPVAEAKPSFSFGLVGGLSTERFSGLFGPRLALGLCLGIGCMMLEGDVPLVPDVRRACDGRGIQYRPVSVALRLFLRSFEVGDVLFGVGLGFLTRFGLATLEEADASRVATNFGLRAGLEVTWRFSAPLELAFELGVDGAVSQAVFLRRNRPAPGVICPTFERLFVEDALTVWGALSLRFRPI